jgi:cytoskeletal protein CcmA (bactofilin family)
MTAREKGGSGADDSVIARYDHVEGTFTSRGTVVVLGSVKGRIEAVRIRIEAGALVEADVIVDEAIVAGEFSGNLTCRERLEAHASGRIRGHVETYKLMLHEGASVEGEMHMLSEAPRDVSTTIRGTAPLRGEGSPESRPAAAPAATSQATPPVSGSAAGPAGPAPSAPQAGQSAGPSAVKVAPTVTPAPAAKAAVGPSSSPPAGGTASTSGPDTTAQRQRSAIVETLRLETLRVAPRATPSTRPASPPASSGTVGNGSRGRSGSTPTGF